MGAEIENFTAAFIYAGVGLVLNGRTEKAEEAYRKAIEHKPDLAIAWNNFAVFLNEQGRTEESLDAFQKAVKHKPYDAIAWHYLGVLFARQERRKEALKALRVALLFMKEEKLRGIIKQFLMALALEEVLHEALSFTKDK